MFQPIYNIFTIIAWKLKGLSDETIMPPTAPANILAPKLKWFHNSKIAVKLNGSCLKLVKATFSPKNVVNVFVVCRLNIWSRCLNTIFTLGDCLFGTVKLTKNTDPDESGSSGQGIGLIYV